MDFSKISPEDCSPALDRALVPVVAREARRLAQLSIDCAALDRTGHHIGRLIAGKARHAQAIAAWESSGSRLPFSYTVKAVGEADAVEDYPRGWILETAWAGDTSEEVSWYATRRDAYSAMMSLVRAVIPTPELRRRRIIGGYDLTPPGVFDSSFVRFYRTDGAGIFRGSARGFGPYPS